MSGASVKQIMCVEEEEKSIIGKRTGKQWCDLPHELLSAIAAGLGLIDLLSFRGVCKHWRCAEPSASVESMHGAPWFLMYGEGSKCSLLSNEHKVYALNIPEFDGATCVASNDGWLLLFSQGSMFFFCPFSRAKIVLPRCPFTELPDPSVAAFSSAPTCQDCIVAVAMMRCDHKLELRLLFRGDNQWVEHEYRPTGPFDNKLGLATYHNGAFHICDSSNGLVTFVAAGRDIECQTYLLVARSMEFPKSCTGDGKPGRYVRSQSYTRSFMLSKEMDKTLAADSVGSFSISTCGTRIPDADTSKCHLIFNEMIWAHGPEGCPSRDLKGVWIQPRYFQISPDQSW